LAFGLLLASVITKQITVLAVCILAYPIRNAPDQMPHIEGTNRKHRFVFKEASLMSCFVDFIVIVSTLMLRYLRLTNTS
jgi:hypothetical protein